MKTLSRVINTLSLDKYYWKGWNKDWVKIDIWNDEKFSYIDWNIIFGCDWWWKNDVVNLILYKNVNWKVEKLDLISMIKEVI